MSANKKMSAIKNRRRDWRRRCEFREDTANTPRASARWLKERNRWPNRPAQKWIPFLLLLLSRSANPSYEARTRIPPAPPVSHLSRPAAASIASTLAGPVWSDPRHMRCRRPLRLWLLLLPTFCRLLRCRFLRFSLLRHCCPPSVSVDGDIGAVQSRIDPHYNPITTAGKK